MKNRYFVIFISFILFISFSFRNSPKPVSWIRINQLGYTPNGIKVAVWCGQGVAHITAFQLVDEASGKVVYTQHALKNFGAYGPFENTYRLNFTSFKKAGRYF